MATMQPTLKHSYCSTCHPTPDHVTTLCGSQGRAADQMPGVPAKVSTPDCVVCIDLLTHGHACVKRTA